MNKAGLLVIDDEPQMRRLLRITLEAEGYAVREAATGREGLLLAAAHPPDGVLLDMGLPDGDGLGVLRQLREWWGGPVLIVSVRHDEATIVSALDGGANDYIVKPFRSGELLARIRSALRPAARGETAAQSFGSWSVDLAARAVRRDGELVHLTDTEYRLLALLVQHEGRVLTHQQLLREIWGPSYVGSSQYLRVYVGQLRKKLEPDPDRPRHFLTESGVGYRFVAGAG